MVNALSERVRRPADLIRLVIAANAIWILVFVGVLAVRTSFGIEADLTTATRQLPGLAIFLLNVVGASAILILPLIAAVRLTITGQSRLFLESLLAAGLAVLAAIAGARLLTEFESSRILITFTGSLLINQSVLLNPLLASLVAFITVSRIVERPYFGYFAIFSVIALITTELIAGGTTLIAQGTALLIGWSAGLLIRYLLGTPTIRPSLDQINKALKEAGYDVEEIDQVIEVGEGRKFVAYTKKHQELSVLVRDRDRNGAGVIFSWLRSLFFYSGKEFRGISIRRKVEQAALMSFALESANIRTPKLLLVREIEFNSILSVYERIPGVGLAEYIKTNGDIKDETLKIILETIYLMHQNDIVHRSLSASNILLADSGDIYLLNSSGGNIAANSLEKRVDLAEILITLAVLTSPRRVIGIAKKVYGNKKIGSSLPALQTVAMSRGTRKTLRSNKKTLSELRKELGRVEPTMNYEDIQFGRINYRNLLLAAVSIVALYLLIPQFSQVDFSSILTQASWNWMLLAVLAKALSYGVSATNLLAFVKQKISFLRTTLAQVSASFATLVTPPTLGTVAINVRFLQKSGVKPAQAGATVGVVQVVTFLVHVALLLIMAVVVGSQSDLTFRPNETLLVILVLFIFFIVILLSVSKVRAWLFSKTKPFLEQVAPAINVVIQEPKRLMLGILSGLTLNLVYSFAFYASIKAFGGEITFATAAFVYLAGASIGQLAPVPGGIGAVEATLIAALTATGLPSGIALSGVLLYRVVTFWIPVIPGWFAFAYLQKQKAI
jgi:glycosyltransferase 2 family protein